MRIAFITHYGDYQYGSNLSLVGLLDGLKEKGIEPIVIYPKKGSLENELSRRNIRSHYLPYAWWVSQSPSIKNSVRNLRDNLKAVPHLLRFIRKNNCDLVYSNNTVISIGAMVASLTRLPHIWHLREYVNLDWELSFDWGKTISTQFIRKARSLISVSNSIQSYYWGNHPSRSSYVIYNGCLYENQMRNLYESYKGKGVNNGKYKFAIIGYIHPKKGQHKAIQALAQVAHNNNNIKLFVVGGGEKKFIKQCKNLASNLGIDRRVEFTGYVNDPYRIYTEADAILMCSENEAMGRVTAEAMSACKPVIGRDSGGTSELIKHNENGLLYDGDVDSLASSMEKLSDNPGWSRELGGNAWKFAINNFTIEKYSNDILKVLNISIKS